MCSLHFSAGYWCVGVHALDCLGVAGQEQTSPLIMVAIEPVFSSFAGQVLGLEDSGASLNFMSHELCMKLGWMVDKHQQASVHLVNGTVVTSEGRATGILKVGPWRGLISVQVLPLLFDLVLGLPWLKQCGPRPDWSGGKLFW